MSNNPGSVKIKENRYLPKGTISTLHGLRATAVADRRAAGTEDGAIADEIGMSSKMVSRYVRFADKAASARASRDRREGRR